MVKDEPINKPDSGEFITFDKERFARFKRMYHKTLREKRSTFIFDGIEVLVDYAKYVIEYVEGVIKDKGKDYNR